ncbi:DUF4168 domain-containing protein [Pontibacter harenae]|uniref:DUF4168 domain-containing protein n=1 Tax=Pontibacter harenae TaxID=2894083 RepID=UPI001E4B9A76
MKRNFVPVFAVAALCFGPAAFAQQATPTQQETTQQQNNFTDQELQQFVKANAKTASITKEHQQEMIDIIKEEDLEVSRFNEIAQAHRQQTIDELEVSEEEMTSFNNAAQQIVEMQPTAKQEVDDAIEAEGLTVERYEEILEAYEKDPEVKAKVQAIIQQ